MYNIAFIMNGAKSPRGGEFLSLHLITHLRKDLFHPILVYAHEGVIVQKIMKAGIDARQIPLNDKITNVYPREIRLYNPIFLLVFLWRLFISGCFFKLYSFIKNNDIHLIYCADNLSKLIGGITGKMAKIKVVAHCHDDFDEDLRGKIMRIFYLLLLDRILAVSKSVMQFFSEKGKKFKKVINVYNGVDTEIFNPKNVVADAEADIRVKESTVVIGSVGTLDKNKGQRYLIEAMAVLKSEGITNIECLICGIGPEEASLKELVRTRDLVHEVLFLGHRNDIPKILKALDIIVIPSLIIESFSMVAIESMAMNVPVIASKVGGLPEVVDDGRTGILVPPGDVDALCRSITYLIRHPEERLKMGAKGRARVLERFTIEENVRKTEKIFLNVINDNN